MTILVIHLVTSLDFGGVEKHMEVIAGHLDRARMRHVFVALGSGGAVERRLMAMGADVRCLGKATKIPSLSAIVSLLALFLRMRPGVVHAHGAEANFHGLLAAWLARVPVRIAEEIGIPTHSAKGKFVFRQIYRVADRVVGISQSVTDWLVSSGEVPLAKAVRVYNPVELPSVGPSLVGRNNVFRIGFVGRLEPVKNPLALLKAFEILVSRGISAELWFVGDGSQRGQLQSIISQKGYENIVKLWGYQTDPVELVRQCDIYVQPSVSEGFGLALVEAMGCGVPVISTSVGGAPEIVAHGKTGWLLPEANAESIAGALEEAVHTGRDRLSEMGRSAQDAVGGRFDPRQYIEEVELIYSGTLSVRA